MNSRLFGKKAWLRAQLDFGSFHLFLDMTLLQAHMTGIDSDGERMSLDIRAAGFKPYIPP